MEVPRLGTWAGVLLGCGDGVWTAKSEWAMRYLMLSANSMLLIFSSKDSFLSYVHLDRCKVELHDLGKTEELTGMGILKISALDAGIPCVSHQSASSLYILLSSSALQRTWYSALQTAMVENMKALDRAFSKSPLVAPSTAAAAAAMASTTLGAHKVGGGGGGGGG